ncbi:MAG: HepT-like ribonuclease domain-containing protein [Ignavibacteriota bacterium]
MLESTRTLEGILEGVSKEAFVSDIILRNAAANLLIVIGEAANHVSKDLCDKYVAIPWQDVIDNRNMMVHGYFSISWSIVWETATVFAIPLHEQIFQILESDFPGW